MYFLGRVRCHVMRCVDTVWQWRVWPKEYCSGRCCPCSAMCAACKACGKHRDPGVWPFKWFAQMRAAHFEGQRPIYHGLPFSERIFLLVETHSLSGKLLWNTQNKWNYRVYTDSYDVAFRPQSILNSCVRHRSSKVSPSKWGTNLPTLNSSAKKTTQNNAKQNQTRPIVEQYLGSF